MNILLVDDNTHALNRLNLAVNTACPNESINTFSDPSEALLFSTKIHPDIAFLDIEMNGMNGLVLGKTLREINPALRLVYCTGYSEYAVEALKIHASGYLLKPISEEDIKQEIASMQTPFFVPYKKRIVIQTFGSFEVFVDNKLVCFSRNKAKEILAILVDNNGSTVKSEIIADIIWEDGIFDKSRKKQLYTIISDLRKNLADVGAEDILIKGSKGYAVNKSMFDCDLYRLFNGDLTVLNNYNGKYMYEYSWAEFSIGKINKFIKNIK